MDRKYINYSIFFKFNIAKGSTIIKSNTRFSHGKQCFQTYHNYLVRRHGIYYLSFKIGVATIQNQPTLDAQKPCLSLYFHND